MRETQEWVGAWREWAMELVSLEASEVAPFCRDMEGSNGYGRGGERVRNGVEKEMVEIGFVYTCR